MNDRDRIQDEKLTRLLQSAGPESIPALEPDPHLAARIRAMVRDGVAQRAPAGGAAAIRPRWAWLSLGTAALALSVMLGGYIGYHAGTATATSTAVSESASDDEAFLSAWSQSGFAEDLGQFDTGNGEENQ